jgi:hypothetical protein
VKPRSIAAYGAWKSPITSSMIGEQMIGLSETSFDDGKIYWLESRPPENGRSVIVCRPAAGAAPQDVTAKYEAGCPYYNIRTGAHGYGGGAWIISSGVAYFSNYSDGRLYRQDGIGAKPVPLTPSPSSRGLLAGIFNANMPTASSTRRASAGLASVKITPILPTNTPTIGSLRSPVMGRTSIRDAS